MSAKTPRQMFQILLAYYLEHDETIENRDYVDDWQPGHVGHPEHGGDDQCPACWLADFDRSLNTSHQEIEYRDELRRLTDDALTERRRSSETYWAAITAELARRKIAAEAAAVVA